MCTLSMQASKGQSCTCASLQARQGVKVVLHGNMLPYTCCTACRTHLQVELHVQRQGGLGQHVGLGRDPRRKSGAAVESQLVQAQPQAQPQPMVPRRQLGAAVQPKLVQPQSMVAPCLPVLHGLSRATLRESDTPGQPRAGGHTRWTRCVHSHQFAPDPHLEEGEEAVEARPGRPLAEVLAARVQQRAHLGAREEQVEGGSVWGVWGAWQAARAHGG